MMRWAAAILFPGLVSGAVGCHTSTGTGTTQGSGDDASMTSCPCLVMDDAGQNVVAACGQITCVDDLEYLCENGVLSRSNSVCVPPTPDACAPLCPANQCGISDGCGGTCQCTGNDHCVFHNCSSNGCLLSPGAYCGFDPEAGLANCCASGEQCTGADAATPSQCCVMTNTVQCATNAECCDYPNVMCVQQMNDAGHPVGSVCQ